jgi:thiol-disulfide isomerase/thioredoxin
MNTTYRTLIVCGSLCLGTLAVSAGEFPDDWTWDDTPADRSVHAALEGKPMPKLDLSEWVNGEVKPADMKGKVVVVDFYATWCGPCMAAIPHNNELVKEFKDKGLVFVAVCTSKGGQDKMASVAKEKGMKYPTAKDAKLVSGEAWEAHYYPTYAVVDRKGIVRAIGLQPQHVKAVVEKLLAEPAP